MSLQLTVRFDKDFFKPTENSLCIYYFIILITSSNASFLLMYEQLYRVAHLRGKYCSIFSVTVCTYTNAIYFASIFLYIT